MKVAIAGSGAIGSRFGYMLHKAGNDVILIDKWPEHVNTIRSNGFTVDEDNKQHVVNIPIYYPNEVNDVVDVVFMFTKSMGLGDMLEDIKPILGPKTSVVSLLNGIGHEDVLKHYIPMENIFLGVTILTSHLEGPGHVAFSGAGTTEIQNFVHGESEAQMARNIVKMLDDAGLNTSYSEDVKFSIWRKACVNGAMNATCALLDCNLAEFAATNQSEPIIRSIVKEFVNIASQKGTQLDEGEMVQYILESARNIGSHYPSMHQDLVQNHRLTEVDFLNGAIARMASEDFNTTAPYNELTTRLIHAKEQVLATR
ncbi:2-dehydropantoate 2-reductase [Lentibacillus sp. JNUCC-1]|uniref:2-dehydropantoate 2-reductase n=1 Tax=Lentibacillus sp. JNUCC-1 TaxID=2654513 RepID=UPI0012E8FE46|nr:2-dehydropantoate 2-reductase [Lentibacillus sp. JNUCC-1]MUV38156.1 2-dehydropantoate 2-reductase [Lentibacillus sp. JNUCC-1]